MTDKGPVRPLRLRFGAHSERAFWRRTFVPGRPSSLVFSHKVVRTFDISKWRRTSPLRRTNLPRCSGTWTRSKPKPAACGNKSPGRCGCAVRRTAPWPATAVPAALRRSNVPINLCRASDPVAPPRIARHRHHVLPRPPAERKTRDSHPPRWRPADARDPCNPQRRPAQGCHTCRHSIERWLGPRRGVVVSDIKAPGSLLRSRVGR